MESDEMTPGELVPGRHHSAIWQTCQPRDGAIVTVCALQPSHLALQLPDFDVVGRVYEAVASHQKVALVCREGYRCGGCLPFTNGPAAPRTPEFQYPNSSAREDTPIWRERSIQRLPAPMCESELG